MNKKVLAVFFIIILSLLFFKVKFVKCDTITIFNYGTTSTATYFYTDFPITSSYFKAIGVSVYIPEGEELTIDSVGIYCKRNGAVTEMKENAGVWYAELDGSYYFPNSTYPIAISEVRDGGTNGENWGTSYEERVFNFYGSNRVVLYGGNHYFIGMLQNNTTPTGFGLGMGVYRGSGGSIGYGTNACYWTDSWRNGGNPNMRIYCTSGILPVNDESKSGSNGNENGDNVDFYTYWYLVQDGNLSGYIHEWNMTGSFINSTWTAFSQNNETWANYTLTLNCNIGDFIVWRVYANSSDNTFATTSDFNITVQTTVTFYCNTGGIIYRNSTLCLNTTQTTYTEPTILEMIGICNSTYGYYNMTWYNGLNYTVENPYIYTVQNRTDFNIMFSPIGTGTAPTPTPTSTGGEYTEQDLSEYFILGGVFSILIFGLLVLPFMIKRRKK